MGKIAHNVAHVIQELLLSPECIRGRKIRKFCCASSWGLNVFCFLNLNSRQTFVILIWIWWALETILFIKFHIAKKSSFKRIKLKLNFSNVRRVINLWSKFYLVLRTMHCKIFTFLWSESILGTTLAFDLSEQRRASILTIFKQVY